MTSDRHNHSDTKQANCQIKYRLVQISSALASPDLVLEAQPPAQPHSRVVVEHPIRFAGGSNAKVVGPSAERLVQLIHQPCGLLPSTRSVGQRVNSFDHALDALL